MDIYEYRPNAPKKKEKTLVAFCFCSAILLFAASYIPNVFLPWCFQVLAVVDFGIAICFASRYLLRSFCYRVESSDLDSPRDFVIVETCGKRQQTVCRISVSDIELVERVTKENQKEILQKTRPQRTFQYHSQMDPIDHYLLTVLENEERIYLMISADARLIELISFH